MQKSLRAAALLACISSADAGDMTVAQFQATKEQQFVVGYVNGLGQGFLYANSFLMLEGKPPIYCQPMGLALVGVNYIQLIESEIKTPSTRPYNDDSSVEVVLLRALRANFPCGK